MGYELIQVEWLLFCATLVFLMQAGFACVEAGLVRSKNNINVAFKNLSDFTVSALLFTLVGYAIMFGPSWNGWLGTAGFGGVSYDDPRALSFFIFQLMFCGTATTIVSGAVAERMRFSAYCLLAAFTSALVYPVVGHWIWSGMPGSSATGWLGAMGFVDFAGSTVVHSVGGWVSLAAILVIGPRIGRFGIAGRPIDGHDLPTATLGVFLLWFGWLGFNGGSTFAVNEKTPLIFANTLLAGAAGGLSAMLYTWWRMGIPLVDKSMNGVLAGLVAITASAHIQTLPMAIVIGGVGGLLATLASTWLERLQIDDAVGAVPVHLFGGIFGTLAVVLAPIGSWGEASRISQLATQALGALAVGALVFPSTYWALRGLNRVLPLRVSPEDERVGLNVAEHAASSSLLDLIVQMDQQAREGDFKQKVDVEPETEAARIALFYNAVLERFNIDNARVRTALEKLGHLANHDTLTGLGNRRLFFEAVQLALDRRGTRGSSVMVLYLDLDRFKPINDQFGHDVGDEFLRVVAQRMKEAFRGDDVPCRLGGDEFAVVSEGIESVDAARARARELMEQLAKPAQIGEHRFQIEGSIGIALIAPGADESTASAIKKADEAMFLAKAAGRGRIRIYGEDG